MKHFDTDFSVPFRVLIKFWCAYRDDFFYQAERENLACTFLIGLIFEGWNFQPTSPSSESRRSIEKESPVASNTSPEKTL